MARPAEKKPKPKVLYRAPALEKGLDVIELLAREERPLTVSAIVQRLGRSTGELFRMIQVLEARGFVSQSVEGYSLTNRLFNIGLGRPPVRNLVEIALPVMRNLASEVRQSCHIGVRSGGNFVVVARMEAREQLGYSVRIGYHQPLHMTTSGLVLYGFQSADTRAEWDAEFLPVPSKATLAAFRRRADQARADRFARQPSNFADGITDLAAPILRGGQAAASLSMPYFHIKGRQISVDRAEQALREAAVNISAELLLNDNRI